MDVNSLLGLQATYIKQKNGQYFLCNVNLFKNEAYLLAKFLYVVLFLKILF